MKFSIFQESRIGGRSSNQDRVVYCYSRESLLMVVADGMGGHKHGEVAAQLAVQVMTQAFQRKAQPTLEDPFHFLDDSAYAAHRIIQNHAFDMMMEETPRTTLVACVVQNGTAFWAHVGDSRLYFIHNGKTLTRTRDHSRIQKLVDQGMLEEAQAMKHPGRNKIYSCLGGEQPPKIELSSQVRLSNNDTLLLCSDGVWTYFSDDEIASALSQTQLSESLPRLLDRAERFAGSSGDNLSAVAMHWREEGSVDNPFTVSTMGMNDGDFTTQQDGFESDEGNDLSDDEIERAISEINASIRKFNSTR